MGADQYYHRAGTRPVWTPPPTPITTYPDRTTQSELLSTNCRLMKDGELVRLLAYEWTPNEYKATRPQERILPGRRGRDLPLRRQGRHDPTDLYTSAPTRPSASPTTPPRTG
ncbi:MAG: hypothetical protein ACLT5P_04190 [Flavonifractor plautii]